MELARHPSVGPSALAAALSTFARSGGAPPEESLACAEESIRLTKAGAGDISYTAALQTAARVRLALGDRRGAASAALEMVASDARNGNRACAVNDVYVAAQVLAASDDGLRAAAVLSGALVGQEFAPLPMQFKESGGGRTVRRRRA
jgi:hypothetical protein